MITLARFPIEDILPALGNGPLLSEKMLLTLADGQTWVVKNNTLRLKCLRNSISCVWCGLFGNAFLLERPNKQERPHLNLYYTYGQRSKILMTRDHVIPLSLGGKDTLDNSATMCEFCNGRKSNHLPLAFVANETGWNIPPNQSRLSSPRKR